MDIHLRMKARRLELELTQAQLADLSQVSQQHLSLIETGRSTPNLKTLGRIFEALQWDFVPQVRPASGLRLRLEGLGRYNDWEASKKRTSDFSSALRSCEDLLILRNRLAVRQSPVDWSQRALEWKQWRRRLALVA